MQETEIRTLATEYLGFFREGQRLDSPKMFALGQLSRLCRDDGLMGFKVAWVIANMAEGVNSKALASLGTGPLKELVRYHGDQLLGLLLEAARECQNFCVALSCVWKNSVDESLWMRLDDALHHIRAHHGGLE